MRQTLTLEKLYHHLFSTPECDSTSIDPLKHDLVLWLNHHSFEELPDALEYYSYLVNTTSDLEADLTHLYLLDQRGVQVTICPTVTIHICTLLAWAKCFLATYGEYSVLYDLLDNQEKSDEWWFSCWATNVLDWICKLSNTARFVWFEQAPIPFSLHITFSFSSSNWCE